VYLTIGIQPLFETVTGFVCKFQHEKAILKVPYFALKMILIFQRNHLQNF